MTRMNPFFLSVRTNSFFLKLTMRKSVQWAFTAPIKENGLKDIQKFPKESFDRILLDPPCSALGLRPKLFVPQKSWSEMTKHSEYQKKFIHEAVKLLKPGGFIPLGRTMK